MQCFSTPDFRIATSALFDGPGRNHLYQLSKQSSSSFLTVIFGVCVGTALIFELCNPEELDLQDISPIPYTPMSASPDSFRTLVLLPGTGSRPIRCELASAQLSESPSYEALSYQWGDQKRLKAIFVNDVKVAVAENLWLALSSLRHAQHPKSLWADAICINQQDDDEKALQIPIMGSIYQRARSVIIYLGNHKTYNDHHRRSSTLDAVESTITHALKSDNYTEQPLKLAQDVHSTTLEKQQGLMLRRVKQAVHEVKIAQVGMDYFLRNLIHEKYWKRGWIIQEVVMASENLMVRYGSNSVSWEEFMYWVQGYHQRHPKDDSVRQIVHLDELRQLRSRPGSVLTLAALLDAFKNCFTSRRQDGIFHDKIYAFLGLAHDCPSGSFPVSYKKSAAQIYQDCVTYFWENSSMTPKQRAIELVYFSSLIRRLLTREPALRRKSGRPFGEHPYEASYLLAWQDEQSQPDPEIKDFNFLGSVLFGILIGTFHGIIMGVWSGISEYRTTDKEWFWKASEAEDLALWVSNQEKSESIHDLFVRGMIVEEIQHVGPPYTAVMVTGSEVNDWSLVAANSAMDDADLAAQKEVLSKMTSLVHILRPSTAHSVARLLCPTQAFLFSKINVYTETAADTQEQNIPRIFFGANSSVGLVPSEAQAGDLICRFWNSNTFAVVRREQQRQGLVSLLHNFLRGEESRKNFRLIGRAIMAKADSPDKDISLRLNGELFGVVNEMAIDVPVSLATLTHLTLNTIFWEGT
jgi:hypothetical protein